jgi:hypothetical protein
MSEYGEITLGNGAMTKLSTDYVLREPAPQFLCGLKPYLFSQPSGVGLLNGAIWGKCPDCEGDCV